MSTLPKGLEMGCKVNVVNRNGLSEETVSRIEPVMTFNKLYYVDEEDGSDTLFLELENSTGGIVRIFPERVETIRENVK